jgi:hypothetical protein
MTDLAAVPSLRPPGQQEVDWLEAGAIVLAWVRSAGPIGLVAWRRDGAATAPLTLADAVLTLAARPSWVTRRGGVVRWLSPPPELSPAGRVENASTNDVVRVRAGGAPAVLKVYRVAGAGQEEEAMLAALAGSGLVPAVMNRLVYQPAAGPPVLLALVLESVTGTTLDVPLRRGLESAWRRGDTELSRGDRELLRRVREATGRLHASLARASCRASPRPLARVLADIECIRHFAASAWAHRMLDTAAAALAREEPARADEPAHGDLHLSNVIVDDDRVRFIDLAGDGGPADDFAALRLGLECMCLDIQVDRAGRQASTPEQVAAALGRAAGTAPTDEAALFAPLRRPGADERAWDRWCARAAAELAGPGDSAADRRAYIARLVHDLRYHLEHERTYYADLAWWRLARWCLTVPMGVGHA